jgi:uncharacterized membrane protein YdjX (TVP38/TMEM64 family)
MMKDKEERGQGRRGWLRWVLLAVVVTIGVVLVQQFGDYVNLDFLKRQEAKLNELKSDYPLAVAAVALVIYITVTGLSLPGALVLSLLYGWYFKFWAGLLIVSFASTTGATLAFLMSRYFFRESIERKFGSRLESFQRHLSREGAYFLFSLRLIPAVPFFVINLVMGLTRIRVWTYWWVSQLGMLPATMVIIYTAAGVPSLDSLARRGSSGLLSPQLVSGLILLAAFPWLVRTLKARFDRNKAESSMDAGATSDSQED